MLQLWAKHSGVDARKGMSLDDRLEGHKDLKTTLIGLLELIKDNLTQALSSPDVDGHDDPENAPAMMPKDGNDVDPEEFLIKQKWRSYSGSPWETVGAAVDMLIELTAMIRKSTVRNPSLPAHFRRPDDNYFAEYAKILARNWFKYARRSLTDHLGDTIFVRRRQMLYKMKHEEKIGHPGTHLAPLPVQPTPASLPTREVTPRMEPPKETPQRIKSLSPVAPIFANPIPSSTNISQFDRTRFKHHGRKIRALSGITEGSVSIEETEFSYMYPEPPTLGEKQRHGVCPYCSGLLSASKLTKEAWRKHLHEDLQPYVCISEKCRDPPQFFSNSTQWLQHMDKFHGRDWPQRVHMVTWYCDREHPKREFNSESELREHLTDDHKSLSEAHVNALARRNWGVACRDAHVCPLCESEPSNLVPLMNDKDKASLLFRHIGDHLKALALFSLPSLSTDPASDEQRSSSGANLPTNEDSKAKSARNIRAVSQSDKNLDESLNFDDDPHSLMDAVGSKATINEEHISDVPSELDAALEWKFASSEQEALELDPVLKNWRIVHTQIQQQQVTTPWGLVWRRTLADQIYNTLVESAFNEWGQSFSPNGIIDELTTKKSVARELQARSSSQAQHKAAVESLTEFILLSAKKVFAILILSHSTGQLLLKRMQFLRDKHITDLSLPLQRSWWQENIGYEAGGGGESYLDDSKNETSDSSDDEEIWPPNVVDGFCRNQHTFLAPVFSNTKLSYDLDPDTILPFTKKVPNVAPGKFGRVTRYRIHERHIDQQTMDAGRLHYVDMRSVSGNVLKSATTWENQLKRLSYRNSLNHGHTVRFLAAFRRGQQDGYFMFESASGGNLRDLWHTFPRPKATSELVKAAFRQMCGLTSAIRNAHDYPGPLPSYHGNLEPANIFWFNSDNDKEFGVLKIGGWERQEEAQIIGAELDDTVDFGYGTRRYEAPECRSTKESLGAQSCLGDIWSMGCVMLEFLVWLMYGKDGLEKFMEGSQPSRLSRPRLFFQKRGAYHDNTLVATIHPDVLRWMDHMAADPACKIGTTALGNLLQLIRTRLLVTGLIQGPGPALSTTPLQSPDGLHSSIQSPEGWGRCTSHELELRMREISDENETERYWLAAEPKSPPSG